MKHLNFVFCSFCQVSSILDGSIGDFSVISRGSDEFDDLRGQVFANVAVYKVGVCVCVCVSTQPKLQGPN